MNALQAGFSRVDITPPMGAEMSGYFQARYAEGGYEAKTSSYKAGIAELIIEESKKLLAKLH